MTLFGFQLVPGDNEALAYCCTEQQAFSEARTTRREIVAAGDGVLAPTAVYRIELAELSTETLVAVLNHPDAVSRKTVRAKTLLGFVTED